MSRKGTISLNGKTGDKALKELDSDRPINELKYTISRTDNDEQLEVKLEPFPLDPKMFPLAIKQMQDMNADYMKMSFQKCRNLLNYNIYITITDPEYNEKYKYRLMFKRFLEKLNIIPG